MIPKQLTKLSYPILTKRSIYYLRHKWSGCLFCKSLTKATIYEWHFKSFYTVMGYVCYKVNILNVKFSICLAFCIYLPE